MRGKKEQADQKVQYRYREEREHSFYWSFFTSLFLIFIILFASFLTWRTVHGQVLSSPHEESHGACASKDTAEDPEIFTTHFPVSQEEGERAYHQKYPLHIKLCFSGHGRKMDPTTGKKGEIIMGTHSFFYIKGACQDKESPYPLLKKCLHEGDLTDPNAGVGVGVKEGLKNVNFTIIPTLDILLSGYLKKGEKLTKELYSSFAEKLVDEGVYQGVEWHDFFLPKDRLSKKVMKAEERDTQIILAKLTRGSDWGIALGRTVHCVNIPVQESQLDQILSYLNERNRHYAECSKKGLRFGYITNSCAHLTNNTLAQLNLLQFIPTNMNFLSGLTHVPVPSVSPLDVLFQANDADLSLKEFLQNLIAVRKKKEGLMAPGQVEMMGVSALPGVILSRYNIHQDNEVFDPSEDRYLLSTLFFPAKSHQLPFSVLKMKSHTLYQNLIKDRRYSTLLGQKIYLEQKVGEAMANAEKWKLVLDKMVRKEEVQATSESPDEVIIKNKLKRYLKRYYDKKDIKLLQEDMVSYLSFLQSRQDKISGH